MSDPIAIRPVEISAPHGASASPYRAMLAVSIDEIAADWYALERRAVPSVFQSILWCRTWLDRTAAVGRHEDVRLLTVYRGSKLVLVWPLALRRLGGCGILHQLAEPATQYCDALADPSEDTEAAARAAWDLICSWRDVDLLELRRVRDDAVIAALPPIAQGGSLASNVCSAPFIDGRMAADGFAKRSGKTIGALRRHERKLAEHGPVAFDFPDSAQQKVEILREGLVFKRQWLIRRNMWSNGYFHAAADEFSLALAHSEQFSVCRVTVGGLTAAVEAGVVVRDHYWSLIQSYDDRYALHGPGRLLMWRFLERCPDAGISLVDFLAPAQDYKLQWANAEMPVRDHVIARTLKGTAMANALVRGRPALKRAFALLPSGARRGVIDLVRFASRVVA
jgi:CelD/BcsL family acetyltransferase involved in cellulose biosynthesis